MFRSRALPGPLRWPSFSLLSYPVQLQSSVLRHIAHTKARHFHHPDQCSFIHDLTKEKNRSLCSTWEKSLGFQPASGRWTLAAWAGRHHWMLGTAAGDLPKWPSLGTDSSNLFLIIWICVSLSSETLYPWHLVDKNTDWPMCCWLHTRCQYISPLSSLLTTLFYVVVSFLIYTYSCCRSFHFLNCYIAFISLSLPISLLPTSLPYCVFFY